VRSQASAPGSIRVCPAHSSFDIVDGLVAETLTRYRGVRANHMGDGIFVVFDWVIADIAATTQAAATAAPLKEQS